jgi:hypothetical protein
MMFLLLKATAFGNLECFEKWPLAAESEILDFFLIKVQTHHFLKRQV